MCGEGKWRDSATGGPGKAREVQQRTIVQGDPRQVSPGIWGHLVQVRRMHSSFMQL